MTSCPCIHCCFDSDNESHLHLLKLAFALNRTVFDAIVSNPDPKAPFNDVDAWLTRAKKSGTHLIVAWPHESDSLSGFLFAIRRDDCTHIWLAGVDEEARGQGIWKKMLNLLLDKVREAGETPFVTINTIPTLFPAMYASLTKSDFEETGGKVDGVTGEEKKQFRLQLTER